MAALDIAFNPPQFYEEYDGVKMRQLVEELERMHAVLTADTDDEGITSTVDSFNGRYGDIVPIQADYDSFFLTPAEGDALFLTPSEGDAAYAAIGNVVNSFEGRQGTVSAEVGDYADVAETYTVLQTFNADITLDHATAINWIDDAAASVELLQLEGGGSADAYASDVALLMYCEGSDASTTFTDSSPLAATLTYTGNAQIDTAQSRFGSSSILFDGSGDSVLVPYNAEFLTGTGDFTIEYSVRMTTVSGSQTHMNRWETGSNSAWFVWNNGGTLNFYISTNGSSVAYTLTSAGYFTGEEDTWVDVAISKVGTNIYLLKNGVHVTTLTGVSGAVFGGASALRIGAAYNSIQHVTNGHMDNIRFTPGVGRYTTSSYTVVDFADGGGSDFTIGDPAVNLIFDGLTTTFTSDAVAMSGDLTVTGDVLGDNLNISNWDTAYGWGDHSSAGYAASSHNHSASQITSGTFATDRIRTIDVADTRAVDDAPDDFDNAVQFDFKDRSVLGYPGNDSYGGVMTIAPWGDASGGPNYQLAFSNFTNVAALAVRVGDHGATAGDWGDWSSLLTSEPGTLSYRIYDSGHTDYAQFSHDGTDFLLDMTDGSSFRLRGGGASDLMILANDDGSVVLYNDGTSQLATQQMNATGTTSGANVKDHEGTVIDVGFNKLPKFNFNASDTLEATHCGHITGKTNTSSYTLTGPTSSDVDFPVDGVAHVWNLGASANYTISDTSTCTMYYCDGTAAPVDIVGSGTLAPGGMITLWRYSTTAIYITGSGFTP